MIKTLCSINIEWQCGLEVACHPDATHFRCESGRIRFYRVNPKPSPKLHAIPPGTNVIQFNSYRRYYGWVDYGKMDFISHWGNILKTEDYNK